MGVKRIDFMLSLVVKAPWIPAFTGMTELRKGLLGERGLIARLEGLRSPRGEGVATPGGLALSPGEGVNLPYVTSAQYAPR